MGRHSDNKEKQQHPQLRPHRIELEHEENHSGIRTNMNIRNTWHDYLKHISLQEYTWRINYYEYPARTDINLGKNRKYTVTCDQDNIANNVVTAQVEIK